MNLAIVHYHLNRGGVARVIECQLRALDAAAPAGEFRRVAILYGGRREGFNAELPEQIRSIRLVLEELPELDYDAVRPIRSASCGGLADSLAAALSRLDFSPATTIVHVHNHSVGKNVELPTALTSLAEQGYRLLLQIHDFAEDWRPDNFRRFFQPEADESFPGPSHGAIYPQAPHIHYAVLNNRDLGILREAGVATGRTHFLPNPALGDDGQPPQAEARRRLAAEFGVEPDQRFVLYPVRCIRRKNVGEALLYSRLAPAGTVVGLTLPPLNPAETPFYVAWKAAAAELNLPCRFEVGAPGALTFPECLAAADLMLSTSVAEGFGMVFLEAWLTGNALIGRDLPEITADFTRAGLRLDLLRSQLLVPLDWVGRDAIGDAMAELYLQTLAAYGRSAPADLAAQIREKTQAEYVDFGDLDESMQRQLLEAACETAENRSRLLAANPGVEQALRMGGKEAAERIRTNRMIVEDSFSLAPSGERLLAIYRRLAATVPEADKIGPVERPQRILDRFLDLKRFRMIRS